MTTLTMETSSHKLNIAFFGTPEFAVTILDQLKKNNILPSLIVTAPDKPKGRKLILSAPPVKKWALENTIDIAQPTKLDKDFVETINAHSWDLFIVAAYGLIIPQNVLDIPHKGSLNVHPSLLPKFRGASPIESSILGGATETGVTIMLIDEKMDHGPLLSQLIIPMKGDENASELEMTLAELGGELLAKTIPSWIHGELQEQAQIHDKATFTKKMTKEDGLIDLNDDPTMNYRKIRAYKIWPGTYFFVEKNGKKIRVIIKDASIEKEELCIHKVLPEGKKEMKYEDFLKGL